MTHLANALADLDRAKQAMADGALLDADAYLAAAKHSLHRAATDPEARRQLREMERKRRARQAYRERARNGA